MNTQTDVEEIKKQLDKMEERLFEIDDMKRLLTISTLILPTSFLYTKV